MRHTAFYEIEESFILLPFTDIQTQTIPQAVNLEDVKRIYLVNTYNSLNTYLLPKGRSKPIA